MLLEVLLAGDLLWQAADGQPGGIDTLAAEGLEARDKDLHTRHLFHYYKCIVPHSALLCNGHKERP